MGLSVPTVVVAGGLMTGLLGGVALINVRLLQPRGAMILLGVFAVAGVGFATLLIGLDFRSRRLAGSRQEKGLRSRQSDRVAVNSAPETLAGGESR